jgi:hypothetical protein
MVLSVHAAAAACVLATMTGVPALALALLTVALGGASAWDRALLRGARSPRAIEFRAGPGAVVVLANGEAMAVRAVRGIGVTRHWVALAPVSFPGRSVLVTAGMAGPAGARLLRLWALWGRPPGAAAGPPA